MSSLADKLQNKTPHLVLVDTDLSWMCPLQAAMEVRHRLDCPIIFLHSKPKCDEGFVKDAFKAGATDILRLPYDEEELLAIADMITKL